MQRSVIQLAGKTLVISLPSKWCKQNGVKKGDALEVGQAPGALVIRTTQSSTRETATIDVGDCAANIVWHELIAAYRAGFKTISVTFRNNTLYDPRSRKDITALALISRVVPRLVGMELVHNGKKTFLLQEVTTPNPDDFTRAYGRMLQLVRGMYAADKDPHREENILLLEEQLNRLADFCERTLTTAMHYSASEIIAYTRLVNALEELGDDAKRMTENNTLAHIDKASAAVFRAMDALQSNDMSIVIDALKKREGLERQLVKDLITNVLDAQQSLLYARR